jgi:hypothetical protein
VVRNAWENVKVASEALQKKEKKNTFKEEDESWTETSIETFETECYRKFHPASVWLCEVLHPPN